MPKIEADDYSQVPAESDAYTPQLYVARPEEILIEKKIDERAEWGTFYNPVVEFYNSVLGSGKTWLLRSLASKHALQVEAKPPISLITAFVDLEAVSQKQLVLQELTRQIDSSLPENEKTKDLAAGDKEEEEGNAAKQFVAHVSTLSNIYTPVLLFDNLTSISEEFASWLEKRIVYPLARTGKVLFVFSGDASIRWENFEVRRRVESVELSAFDRVQTHDLLTKTYDDISEDETDAVFHFSAGLPSAIAEVLRLLRENNGIVDGKFVGSVYETIVDGQLLKEVPEDLKPFLSVIAPLRKFNPSSIELFVAKFLGPEYRDKPYIDVLKDMRETGLVRWSDAEGGYCLHPVARRIMDRNLAVRDPDHFGQYHSEASELYQNLINKYPRSGIGFLLELMYHQALTMRVRNQPLDGLAPLFIRNLYFLEDTPDIQWDLSDMSEFLFQKLGATAELTESPGSNPWAHELHGVEDTELAEILGPDLWARIKMSSKGFLKHRISFLD